MEADLPPRPIDLAREPAFELAGLEVRPATLELLASGRREQIEPRIMQVLVALAQRRGEVVSRDELIQRCWGGRIVGDDSINRCIFRLRKLAQSYGGFEIETVPRVGFRLTELGAAAARKGSKGWLSPRAIAGAVAVFTLTAVATGIWISRSGALRGPAREPRVVVQSFEPLGSNEAARAFGLRLADQVEGVLDENIVGVAVQVRGVAATMPADLSGGGTVSRDGNHWRVRAYLEDARSKTTLWSAQYERDAAEEAGLRDQVAAGVADAIATARAASGQPGVRLDPATTALFISANESLQVPRTLESGEALQRYEQLVRRAPDFAMGRAGLAIALSSASRRAPSDERRALEARATHEAERAIRTDPATGGYGYDVLAGQQRSKSIAGAESLILKGIGASPELPFLPMRECRILVEVGRARDALAYCERANALRPLAAPLGYSYAHALYVAGETHLAEAAADRAYRYHPDHLNSWRTRFEMAAFTGSPDVALTLLDAPLATAWHPEGRAALRQYLTARKTSAPADSSLAMTRLWTAVRAGRVDPRYVVLAAASLGRVDEAFAALEDPAFQFNGDLGYLFEPVSAPLRTDARFWRVARRAGYVTYWQTRNRWPDFCSDPAVRIDCRREAAKVAG